jgi:hypothetical protein
MRESDKENYCRARATECEQKAQAASSPEIKTAFLELKRRWLQSAEQAKAEDKIAS